MTSNQATRTARRFTYDGFGFPVVLHNVPMVRIRRKWTPMVDYDALARRVLLALSRKPARLTGSEIRFVRLCLAMTLSAFGARFDVSHPAVP